jgi:hypothetical protein
VTELQSGFDGLCASRVNCAGGGCSVWLNGMVKYAHSSRPMQQRDAILYILFLTKDDTLFVTLGLIIEDEMSISKPNARYI